MTDPNTIPRALEWIANAEAGVLDAYRVAVVGTHGADSPFCRAVLPAILQRQAALRAEQQRRRR